MWAQGYMKVNTQFWLFLPICAHFGKAPCGNSTSVRHELSIGSFTECCNHGGGGVSIGLYADSFPLSGGGD